MIEVGLADLLSPLALSRQNRFLLLVRFEKEMKGAFVGWQTVERVVTKHVPAEDLAGAYSIVPADAGNLRQKLFALTTDGGPLNPAARWLRQIDLSRDEHGTPETEPRHPEIGSGKPWPILSPDPDETD